MTIDLQDREHRAVFPVLDDYALGLLDTAAHEEAARHIAACPACREELASIRAISAAFDVRPEQQWQPAAGHFDQLMAMVDEHEQQEPHVAAAAPPRPPKPAFMSRLRAYFMESPAALRWTLGLETFAIAGLAVALVLPRMHLEPSRQANFETLTSVEPATDRSGFPRLHVVFAEDMLESELRGLLESVGGQIVAGPSAVKVYTVELAQSANASATVQALRANPKVKLAEPVVTSD
jgi:hypothetical protein